MNRLPRFFLDSADPAAWQPLVAAGWIHGITTNPLVLEQDGLPTDIDTARRLSGAVEELQVSELQFQVWGETAAEFLRRGRQLMALSPVITLKVPATAAGFEAAHQLQLDGARITLTACYTVAQCALANAMQLDYVAPYYGRMLEASIDADARLDGMRQVCRRPVNASSGSRQGDGSGDDGSRLASPAQPGRVSPPRTRILIASLRTAAQVDALLSRGFDTFTLRPALAHALMVDDASARAAAEFEAAACQLAAEPGSAPAS